MLCLLARKGTLSPSAIFTLVWDTPGKEKIAKWSSAPASMLEGFNQIEGQKPFQNCPKDPSVLKIL